MKVVALSQKGARSSSNEDAYLNLSSQSVFVLADGVGGGPSGNVASRIVVNTVLEGLKSGAVSKQRILESLEIANEKVRMKAEETSQIGMSSTVVVAWVSDSKLYFVNAGDSRAYLYSSERGLKQITEDHTREVSSETKGTKHYVTKAVGSKRELNPSEYESTFQHGDIILLCSDGISDPLEDAKIAGIVSLDGHSLYEKARLIVAEAESLGGSDDKTIMLVSL